ncbi:hypothetical protein [Gymnodinialimonas ceratoperidinii]|uniref:Tetratricopeptide repeat protein n=1 Tax=Gymnodinialimonas ceratoperidinii TaxID=2856823 RepID=A0A8F6Y9L9_9RHOB|nr:hypothetical protein [Gymnodinialimonas ceratoperidinii]QXT38693.1 hypothetical protein KYE46_12195 [Gymnodinialimonas ceratoperidinii]
MASDRFDTALRRARETGDWSEVIALYVAAADAETEAQGAAFYLTHAYVHALEAGDPRAASLKTRLIALGAEVDTPET